MGIFNKKKKSQNVDNSSVEVLQQDLSIEDGNSGRVFIVHLLMEEKCTMPDKEYMTEVMNKHLGNVKCFMHDNKMASFSVMNRITQFKDGSMPASLMITECFEIEKPLLDNIGESQLWDCPNGKEILATCKYHVIANDMLAGGLESQDRAEMLVEYIEALVEMYPECKAVLIDNSGKMLSRESILSCDMPKNRKYINYAVNVRYFTIQGTEDMLVDTIGMSTLYLPELQYHFHGMNPDEVVNHAYNVLSYIYDSNNSIKSGDTIDGIEGGMMSQNVQWKVRYENSLIQPVREVLDVNMNEYAAGQR